MYLGWVHEQNLTIVLYGQEYVTTIFSWTLCIMVVFVFCLLSFVRLSHDNRYSAKFATKSSQSDRRGNAFHLGQDAVGFRFFFLRRIQNF